MQPQTEQHVDVVCGVVDEDDCGAEVPVDDEVAEHVLQL